MTGVPWYLLQRCVALLTCLLLKPAFEKCSSMSEVWSTFLNMPGLMQFGVLAVLAVTLAIFIELIAESVKWIAGIYERIKKARERRRRKRIIKPDPAE